MNYTRCVKLQKVYNTRAKTFNWPVGSQLKVVVSVAASAPCCCCNCKCKRASDKGEQGQIIFTTTADNSRRPNLTFTLTLAFNKSNFSFILFSILILNSIEDMQPVAVASPSSPRPIVLLARRYQLDKTRKHRHICLTVERMSTIKECFVANYLDCRPA